ncbi:MAG: hypothetical protein JSV56_05455 [Methanomassiliicoccales archaeon]|nr:MAG: hypothetical protein JSV56_05455 [Methanomassiliicoccales archaeon]
MQPMVHFLLSIIAGLGVGLHIKNKSRKYLLILLCAVATTGIDLDHLFPIYQNSGVKLFHNVFVFLIIPMVLFSIFYFYEQGKKLSIGQRGCVLLAVMFVGHMFLDGVSGSMSFFYPFSPDKYAIIDVGITLDSSIFALTSLHVILIIWGAVILGANFLETLIYNDVEGRMHVGIEGVKDTVKSKNKKTWLPVVINGLLFVKVHLLYNKRKS